MLKLYYKFNFATEPLYGCFNSRTFNKKIGNKTILEDISLNLKRGQIIGLVGANGKTSLMKVILGYSSYQDGTFRIIENKNKKVMLVH